MEAVVETSSTPAPLTSNSRNGGDSLLVLHSAQPQHHSFGSLPNFSHGLIEYPLSPATPSKGLEPVAHS